uniref:Uncharacterized protein n=1 Tax=Rhizophora mucronata TaxID=61149 RepID=A0A2P2QYU7_RHIMU
MARVYISIAKMRNKLDLLQELQTWLKESQHVLGEAMMDSNLHHSALEKIKAMGQVLSDAKEHSYNCRLVT